MNKKLSTAAVTVFFILSGAWIYFFEEETIQQTQQSKQTDIELIRVVDGDTLVFSENEAEKRLRLLLVDTPESSTTKTGSIQPYGEEAKEFLRSYLKGKDLTIEYDPVHEKTDDYDRYLAYLFADGELVQEVLLSEGLARLGYENGNEQYIDLLERAENQAEKQNRKIWSIEGYVGERGFNN